MRAYEVKTELWFHFIIKQKIQDQIQTKNYETIYIIIYIKPNRRICTLSFTSWQRATTAMILSFWARISQEEAYSLVTVETHGFESPLDSKLTLSSSLLLLLLFSSNSPSVSNLHVTLNKHQTNQ